jgi:hypothetical protein
VLYCCRTHKLKLQLRSLVALTCRIAGQWPYSLDDDALRQLLPAGLAEV